MVHCDISMTSNIISLNAECDSVAPKLYCFSKTNYFFLNSLGVFSDRCQKCPYNVKYICEFWQIQNIKHGLSSSIELKSFQANRCSISFMSLKIAPPICVPTFKLSDRLNAFSHIVHLKS